MKHKGSEGVHDMNVMFWNVLFKPIQCASAEQMELHACILYSMLTSLVCLNEWYIYSK